jgi:diguanylate cyclase (GGDEF)-like protein
VAKILVVDDNLFNREVLVALLESAGHTAVQAANGTEGLLAVQVLRPQLVISDVLMPLMDGVELAQRMQADSTLAAIPVIFYTATYRLRAAAELAHSCGVRTVLEKPSPPQAIFDAIADALGSERIAAPSPELAEQMAARVASEAAALPPPAARQLARDAQSSGGLAVRLATVIELGLELASLREPRSLLTVCCRALPDILQAACAAVCFVDVRQQLQWLETNGLAAEVQAALEADPAPAGALQRVLSSREPLRIDIAGGDVTAHGLPTTHPRMAALLLVPVRTATRVLGWIYAGRAPGGSAFTLEDEHILATLAFSLAFAYDNLVLFNDVQHYAASLEQEVRERRRAEENRIEQQARIVRLAKLYAVMSSINAAILRCGGRAELFDEVCRIAVDSGAFRLAGLAEVEAEAPDGGVTAWHGSEMGKFEPNARPGAPGYTHPASRALRELQPVICNDIGADPALATLQPRGLAELAALPLIVSQRAHGVLLLGSAEAGYFGADECRLLANLAGDLSFALARAEREQSNRAPANYDTLTGLPNLSQFMDHLALLLKCARHGQQTAVLILVEIANLAQLNDAHGRLLGDVLTRAAGARLLAQLPQPGCLSHAGADCFAVAVAGLPPDSDAIGVLGQAVLAPLAEPVAAPNGEVELTVHVGVALYPADGTDAGTLYAHAQGALASAKAEQARYRYHTPVLTERTRRRFSLEGALKRALVEEQFELYYQPRASLFSGHIVGCEALLRWNHPEGGVILPGEFLPLAEDVGLIAPIGEWVLHSLCKQIVAWRSKMLNTVPVSLNLSARQFGDANLLAMLRDVLISYRLEPRCLVLELTEAVAMADPNEAARRLLALRDLGLYLALDDFGTGYSSLAYLKRFPFHIVKIDRAFVRDITQSPEDAAICSAVIAMAHQLNLTVVAEGVETEVQLSFLRLQDCDEMQGNLFSAAVPADDFTEQLRNFKQLGQPRRWPRDSRCVLVVDDDADELAMLKASLQHGDYRLLSAPGGREALDLLALNPVQVIISDQRMPGMNGTDFFSVVRKLYPNTMRIILSAHTDLDVVVDAINNGAVYKVLTKPWSREQLTELIQDAFTHYRRE